MIPELGVLLSNPGGPLVAFIQVVLIDLALAGDNAVAVGLAAAGLPPESRRKVIMAGLGAAVVLRIGFALITTWLLGVIGLLLAGGLLLLWVCWKMWRDLHAHGASNESAVAPAKTFGQAFVQIFVADLSMSLDNVLAVAGAAREHPMVLVAGLLISIAMMGLAASAIAKLLENHRWIGFLGLAIIVYVALHMIWEGHRDVIRDLNLTAPYNAAMPATMRISPEAR